MSENDKDVTDYMLVLSKFAKYEAKIKDLEKENEKLKNEVHFLKCENAGLEHEVENWKASY